MDPSRGRLLHSHRRYTSTPQYNYYYHDNFNRSVPSGSGLFQTTGMQRQNLKWRKEYYHRGNHKSRPPYRRNDGSAKKSTKSEDVEEEERKKKLTDTAKKLLSKIKTWSAGNNCNQVDSEKVSVDNVDSIDKPKRIAHSKKAKLVKKATRKSCRQPTKKKTTYDVNKETVKDFQSRIQHKLMEEIMQMPKENLQNVLNDPKINPIMELKMSRLVRENRLLIAHKLRAIAESKMKSDCPSNPQFLEDIDKLIDPVIESDLSVLPYELIKQMENIFQVQFDYSRSSENSLGESVICDAEVVDNGIEVDKDASALEKNVKVEINEDLSLYECSTDEDEETSVSKALNSNQETNLIQLGEICNGSFETPETVMEFISDKIDCDGSQLAIEEKSPEILMHPVLENNSHSRKSLNVSEVSTQTSSPIKQFASTSCQTECSVINSSTQTHSDMVESLYGAPLPKEATDDSIPSLLQEVNSIQNLVNKLNERRFMIFLELARLDPSGRFADDDFTKTNFIQTLSNDSPNLVNGLRNFFRKRHKQPHKWA